MDPNWKPADPEPDDVADVIDIDAEPHATNDGVTTVASAAPTTRVDTPGRNGARARVLGALVVGGIAGAAILGPLTTAAASPTPTTATAPSATSGTGTDGDHDADHFGGPGGPGGHVEAVTDTSVVAKAIGISEADLKTALAGGQTVAQVARAHNVALQVVIDALVADGTSELAAEVATGRITQAQADAQKAAILQRATDQANGTFNGPGDHGDRGGFGGPGGPFGHFESVTDTAVVAKAIGISESALKTALSGGQTVAQVAKAHNVALQVVINALVADGSSELAAQVANGSITQAQANAEKTEILQRATDQANGTFGGDRP
jgi:hypothetical protein